MATDDDDRWHGITVGGDARSSELERAPLGRHPLRGFLGAAVACLDADDATEPDDVVPREVAQQVVELLIAEASVCQKQHANAFAKGGIESTTALCSMPVRLPRSSDFFTVFQYSGVARPWFVTMYTHSVV